MGSRAQLSRRVLWCMLFGILYLLQSRTVNARREPIDDVFDADDEKIAQERFQELRDTLESESKIGLKSKHVTLAAQRGWWELSKALVDVAVSEGVRVENELQMISVSINKHISELKRQVQAAKPAHSADSVYLEIKFAHKLDAPAALGVRKEILDMSETKVIFKAARDHKKFELELDLLGEIIPEESTFSMASVGRCTIVLKKKEAKNWPNLVADNSTRPSNMHIWWDIKEKYQAELSSIEILDTKKSGKENEEATSSTESEAKAATPPKKKKKKKKKELVPAAKEMREEKKKLKETRDAKLKDVNEKAKSEKQVIDDEASKKKDVIEKDLLEKKGEIEKEFKSQLDALEEKLRPLIDEQISERKKNEDAEEAAAKASADAESGQTEREKEEL